MDERATLSFHFLSDLTPRPWRPESSNALRPLGLFVGQGSNAIEVVVAEASRSPNRNMLLSAWRGRRGGRASPVLLVVRHADGAALCGATGVTPPVYINLDVDQVERLCREALQQPDRHAALRFLAQALPSLETAVPGIRNEGLLALHELQHGVPRRDDWKNANKKAMAVLGKRDNELLRALGFRVERLDNLTSLLRAGTRRTALAVLLRESESAETGAARFNNLSPISYALKKADDENLDWVVLAQGNRLRLYASAVSAGIGRRGRTETYIECQSSLLAGDGLGYLWLIYSAEALARDGSLPQILEGSERFAGNLASQLRERIYDRVVPALSQGVATAGRARAGSDSRAPTRENLAQTYEMALTILFRLLFIAYAEDRDLLPYRFNDAYRRRSLKAKAQELATFVADEVPIAEGDAHWQDANQLWRAVAVGNAEWGIPAYDGGLFTSDSAVSSLGAEIADLSLPNASFEAALRDLLVIDTPEGTPGPVDFRSLGVREFGTIYEGLLESELAVADTDLTITDEGIYVPVVGDARVFVAKGDVYLHNRSGARKSSGSYYTKPFAVEHLLDGALEPALTDHFTRLDALDETAAAESFFDFRIADIAMGSAHFLVAAIDRMEKRLADYLATRPLPRVRRELAALRSSAMVALGDLADPALIEDGQLLRRLIARRCVYGVDANGLATQLARVAIWIHTFVPGLPLSFLDRNLVHGNSLVGVGTLEELKSKFESVSDTLFALNREDLLGPATKPLLRMATLNDATISDIAAAREANREARAAIGNVSALCDVIAAQPITEDPRLQAFLFEHWDLRTEELETLADQARQNDLRGLQPLHFPTAFPEVFLRERQGFDVVIGNPPWREATVEEHAFWARHDPGLRALTPGQQEREKERLRKDYPDLVSAYADEVAETERLRKILVGGGFPGMGTGDPDLYKAFCWRFWRLTAVDGGRIGVVLPHGALIAKGSTQFRETIFRHATRVDVATLLGEWRARPDRELDATNQKYLIDVTSETCPDGFWPVYKGASFDLWTSDTGTYYGYADPEPAIAWIQSKRLRANKRRGNSPHREFDREHVERRDTLPTFAPRLAFRDVSRATDTRTLRASLVPPNVFLVNQAPYLLWPRGDERDTAFLIGVICSLVLDWYARRFVDKHVNYFVFNPLPIPRPSRDDRGWERVVALAGRLASPDDRYARWAESVGVGCGWIMSDEKEDMIHELDAVVAHLYGLHEAQLVHIFETFHEGWDYQTRLDSVLKHFRTWSNRR